jgi:hypothetical protein
MVGHMAKTDGDDSGNVAKKCTLDGSMLQALPAATVTTRPNAD